jgi:hypothetical protein
MIQNIILAATLIVAFFMCISAFLLGIKIGKQLSNNQVPTVQINPVKKVVQAVEQHKQIKQEEKLQDELEDIFSYSKESALNAIKRGDAVG